MGGGQGGGGCLGLVGGLEVGEWFDSGGGHKEMKTVFVRRGWFLFGIV